MKITTENGNVYIDDFKLLGAITLRGTSVTHISQPLRLVPICMDKYTVFPYQTGKENADCKKCLKKIKVIGFADFATLALERQIQAYKENTKE